MTTTSVRLLGIANHINASGCCVVPVSTDGEKRPALSSWTEYRARRTTPEQHQAWFSNGRHDGLGIICGAVSGNLDMFEFEGRAIEEGYLDRFTQALADHNLTELWERITNGYTERTPSGGIHVLYRINGTVRPSTKLACRPSTPEEFAAHKAKLQADTDLIEDDAKRAKRQDALDRITRSDQVPQVLIETRGEGGFVVVAPSGGRTHPTGRPWTLLKGGIDTVATITEDERDALFTIASLFDTMPPPPTPPKPTTTKTNRPADDGDRPGDDFNKRAEWPDILAGHFKNPRPHGNGYTWCREGKDRGISATTGTRGDGDNLWVWSSSTIFEPEKPYTKFGAYALIEFGGDHAAAARELRRRGYGSPRRPSTPTQPSTTASPPASNPTPEPAGTEPAEPAPNIPQATDLVPPPDDPMAVARYITATHMTRDGMYTMRQYNGAWMRWDGPHWSEVTDNAVRAQLYPALETKLFEALNRKGEIEIVRWAPNRRKVADLVEALGAVTYLPETVQTPSILPGQGSGQGADRVEVSTFPQVDRDGQGRQGTSENSAPTREGKEAERAPHNGTAIGKQRGFSPVHPVHPPENGASPAETPDRVHPVHGDLPLSTDPRAIVACANGLLAVETRDLYALTPRFFNRVSVPFGYAPNAPEPIKWLAFLRDLWAEDPEAIDTLQEWFGYLLSGRTDLQKILFLVGPPRSGKGTIGRVMTALVGESNTAATTPTDLPTDFGLAALLGKTLAVMADARTPSQGNEALVERLLTISGEDSVVVKRKYRDDWMGRLPVRFVLMSNDLPGFRDASGAIVSRLTILRLTKSNLGSEDHGLADRLMTELPGIFNWALDGLDRLRKRGHFAEPESSEAARETLNAGVSPIKAFLEECCYLAPEAWVLSADLYEAWVEWCKVAGHKPGSNANFGKLLFSAASKVKNGRPTVNGKKRTAYQGIGLGEASAAPAAAAPRVGTCLGCGGPMDITSPDQRHHIGDPSCERLYNQRHP